MDRKIKIIGMYIGLLFFISILLILITSLSNDKFEPLYSLDEINELENSGLNTTMLDSVSNLTETNKTLNEKIIEYQNKIENLEKEISSNKLVIENYEKTYNEDTLNFYKALKLYVQNDVQGAKEVILSIDRELLSDEDKTIYDFLINELN